MSSGANHIGRIREAIRDYGPDDWFLGCSHGGGIYMRDLRPVLDAASEASLVPNALDQVQYLVEALESIARAEGALRAWRTVYFETASAIEARRAATAETGAVHESAVGEAETPDPRRIA